MTLFEINLWKTSFWTELSKGVGGPTEGSPGAGAAAGEGAGAAAGGAAAGAGAGAGAGFTWPWTWLLTWPLDGLFFAVGASFGTLTALEEAASAGLLWRGAGAAGCGIAPSGLSAFGLGTGATGATGGVPWGGIVFGGTGPPFPFSGKRKGLGLAASGGGGVEGGGGGGSGSWGGSMTIGALDGPGAMCEGAPFCHGRTCGNF